MTNSTTNSANGVEQIKQRFDYLHEGQVFQSDEARECAFHEFSAGWIAALREVAPAPLPVHEQNARFAIQGAIDYGRQGLNKPPSDDHWLMEFWDIGRDLAAYAAATAPAGGLTDEDIQAIWNEACNDSPQNPGWCRHIRFARSLLSRSNAAQPTLSKAARQLITAIAEDESEPKHRRDAARETLAAQPEAAAPCRACGEGVLTELRLSVCSVCKGEFTNQEQALANCDAARRACAAVDQEAAQPATSMMNFGTMWIADQAQPAPQEYIQLIDALDCDDTDSALKKIAELKATQAAQPASHFDAVRIVHEEAGRTLSKQYFDLCLRIAKRAVAQPAPMPVATPFECWSNDDGDSWGGHPADGEFVEGLKVGDTYELLAGWDSVRATYRVTKAPDDESDDYEVECISHPDENSLPPSQPERSAPAVVDEPWWLSMWIAGTPHPNRFDTCKLCGESHPSVLNVLEEHSVNHLAVTSSSQPERERDADFYRGVIAALGALAPHSTHGDTVHEEIVKSVGKERLYAVAEAEDVEWAGLDPEFYAAIAASQSAGGKEGV